MISQILKQGWPHLVAIGLFVILGVAYFNPVLEGKVLVTHDKTQWKGMSKEIRDYRAQFGDEPLWTNSMFGGMPAYMISTKHNKNLLHHIHKIFTLGLPHPASVVFLYMIGFYLLLLAMRIDPWLSILGAIAFGLSSYFLIIIGAGHNSKAMAIGYMAPVLAGVILALRKKYLWGGVLTAFFLGLEISRNHLQITYYLGIVILIFLITYLIKAIKEKSIQDFVKSSVVLGIAALFACLANSSALWTTLEYTDYTTRGKTELTINADGSSNKNIKTSGLDKKYVTAWSYGMGETLTLIIPNAKGGASEAIVGDDAFMKSLRRKGSEGKAFQNALIKNYQDYSANPGAVPLAMKYWGNQSITSGPVYVGIIVFYLFLLGLFFKRGYLKWALLVAFILSVVLSWGKSFMPPTELFLDYFPGYNKFRAVTIILAVTELVVPLLAILGLKYIIENRDELIQKWKLFLSVSAAFLLFFLFLLFSPDTFLNFLTSIEGAYYYDLLDDPEQSGYADQMIGFLETYRKGIFRSDLYRSIALLVLGIGTMFLFIKNKISRKVLIPILGILIFIDLWSVDKRYMNNEKKNGQDKWIAAEKADAEISPAQCDLSIAQRETYKVEGFEELVAQRQEEIIESAAQKRRRKLSQGKQNEIALSVLSLNSNYRVANLNNPFNESRTSYFHKSLGGYHGAKFKRYQEFIEFHLARDMGKAIEAIRANPSAAAYSSPPSPLHAFNMLNARYVIVSPDQVALENPNALGNAWFINKVIWAENADEEITELGDLDPASEVIIDQRYNGIVKEPEVADSLGYIELESYLPNQLVYKSSSTQNQFAVFSEIFYDKGWRAFIDGEESEHIRVNYILRGMNIPAGDHTIEFIFNPTSFSTGSILSLMGSSIIILAMLYLIFTGIKEQLSKVD